MSSNRSNQKSQKAGKMSGRPQNTREDSNMQSEQTEQASSRPMRVAAMRPENQEFKVAGEDFGGLRQKSQPGTSKAANSDEKGFTLPLDKVVLQEVAVGRRGEEPVNHLRQNLEHHVKVGLNRPSLTIFSSMGGSRNGSSTEIEFGGAGGSSKGSNKDNEPKEFEYREEDFQPLTAQGNSKKRGSHGQDGGRSGLSASKNHPVQHESQHNAGSTSFLGLTPSLFKTQSSATHDHATPGVHAHHLATFNEPVSHHDHEAPSSAPAKSKKAIKKALKASKASGNQAEPFNGPAHLLHASKEQHQASPTAQHHVIGPAAHARHAAVQASHLHARDVSPELNLGTLFPEEQSSSSKKQDQSGFQPQQHQQSHHQLQGHSHAAPTHRPLKDSYQADDESEDPSDHHQHQHHIVDHSSSTHGVRHQAVLQAPVKHSQQSHQTTAAPAHASAFPSTNLSKKQSLQKHQQHRDEDNTPVQKHPQHNDGVIFGAGVAGGIAGLGASVASSNKPVSVPLGNLKDKPAALVHHAAPQVHPDPMHHAHAAPTYHAPSATAPALAQSHHVEAPAHRDAAPAHHSAIHQSAMPPIHHDAPAHHSAPDYQLSAEHVTPVHRQAPVVSHPDPMHLAHAAPIYHSLSTTTSAPSHHAPTEASHHTATHIETIHTPYAAGASSHAVGLSAMHGAAPVIQSATAVKPDSAAAPMHQVPASGHKPVLALGRSHDEPVHRTTAVPVLSHADAAGLNAASYPTFAHHAPDQARAASQIPTQRAHEAHINDTQHAQAPIHASTVSPQHAPPQTHAKKPSKRERKAAKKHDATRRQSVMESISSALVGRRKNSVSSPVMRLNELFDVPAGDHSVQEHHGPSTAAASAATVAGGIRSLLGSIHMPAMISRQPSSETQALHAQEAPKMGASSAHGNAIAVHHTPEHVASKAAALRSPKLDLTLFPEEQANYPRGETSKMGVSSAHGSAIATHHTPKHVPSKAAALKSPKLDLTLFPEEQANYPRGETSKMGISSAHGSAIATHHTPKHVPSKAAALKSPKLDLTLFPEEQANYPRGETPKMAASSAHGNAIATHHTPKHVPSKAAALKSTKLDLTLFPEELANYPRGEAFKRENPAHPNSVVDVTEIHYQAHPRPSHHHHEHHGAIGAAAVPLAATAPMILNLHHNQQQAQTRPAHGTSTVPVAQQRQAKTHSAQGTSAAPTAHAQKHHSTAAALRKPKVPLGLFPEEEEDYPRGSDGHHENRPAGPKGKPVAVKEIQLDAAHMHSHHDLHPTMTESATAVVEQGMEELSHSFEGASAAVEHGLEELSHGLDGIWTMLGGIHLPAMPAINSLAAPAATIAVATTAARRAAAPATHTAPFHTAPMDTPIHTVSTPSNTTNTAKKPEVFGLPLMYGTPVHHTTPTTAPAKPEHHAHATAPVDVVAPVLASASVHAAAPVHHAVPTHHVVPAVVPVYIEPTVHYSQQSAKTASIAPSSSSHQQHQAEGLKFAPSEHHNRSMEIHGLSDDEKYFSAEDIQSPAIVSDSTNFLNSRKSENVSVLPPAKPSVHDNHVPAVHSATAPVVAATLGSATIAATVHHHQAAAPVIRIPIAQPPSELKTAPRIQRTQGSQGSQAPTQAPHTVAPVALSSQSSRGSQAPIQSHRAAAPVASVHHSASSTIQAAAPLMGAAAAGVKSDEILMMESTSTTEETPIHAATGSAPAAQQHVHAPIITGTFMQQHAQAPIVSGTSMQQPARAPVASGVSSQQQTHLPTVSAPATQQNTHASIGSASAPKTTVAPGDTIVMMKKTTTTTVLPANVPLPSDSPALTYNSGARPMDTTVLPTLRGENIVIQATATPKVSADLSKHLSSVAAPAAAAIAAASAHSLSASSQAPLANAPRPTLAMHEQDVHKPTPLQAPRPVIPVAQEIKTASRATETVANAPRPVIPQHQQQAKPVEIQTIKTTTTTSGNDLGARPVAIEVKTSKPVTVEAPVKPIVAAAAAAPVMQKTTITTAAAPAPALAPVQTVKPVTAETHRVQQPTVQAARSAVVETHHHSQQPTVQMQKTTTTTTTAAPAPIPAARPVMAAAAAVPVAVSAASTLSNSTATTTTTTHQQQQAPIQLQQPVQMQAVKTTTTAAPMSVPQQQPIHTQATNTRSTDTTIVERPAGYQGALPEVHSGESVIWVKKVYTTQEFYDSEDEDEQQLDQFGYRKDRDVSLHLPHSVTHSPPRRASSGSLSSSNSQGAGSDALSNVTAPQQQGHGQRVEHDLQNHTRPQQQQTQQQYESSNSYHTNHNPSGRGPAM